jgi:hypothetical protein
MTTKIPELEEDKKTERDVQEERASVAGEVLALQGGLDPEKLKEIAEKRVKFFRMLALLSLERTSVHDWADMGGKPYLQATGAEKIAPLWGINTWDTKITIEMDAETGLPTYQVSGRVGSRVLGIEMDVIGGRNANDDFFRKQPHLDLEDVRKAAYSNFLVNAITRLVGLRGLTWEDVAEGTKGRITKEKATGKIEYKKPVEAPAGQPSQSQPVQPANGRGKEVITDKQRRRMYMIGKSNGWQDDEMREFLKEKYGFGHSSEVTRDVYEEICKRLEAGE